jgi:hypothetical protein
MWLNNSRLIAVSQTLLLFCSRYSYVMGHAVAQWLRHCATNLKVARSIPDGVI